MRKANCELLAACSTCTHACPYSTRSLFDSSYTIERVCELGATTGAMLNAQVMNPSEVLPPKHEAAGDEKVQPAPSAISTAKVLQVVDTEESKKAYRIVPSPK